MAYEQFIHFFSSQLIISNFSLMPTIFKQFFIWIVLDDVDLFFSLILVTNYNAVGKETKSAAWLYHLCNQGDDITVPSLSASFQCKTKEAMDHASQSALDQKLAHTTATWKFLKFLCHTLTTYWNFYSPQPLQSSPLWHWYSDSSRIPMIGSTSGSHVASASSCLHDVLRYGLDLLIAVKTLPLELQFDLRE